MKLFSIINKSIKEHVRNFWILALTVSCAPFFVFVYYLIDKSTQPAYTIHLLSNDNGIVTDGNKNINFGEEMFRAFEKLQQDTGKSAIHFIKSKSRESSLTQLKNYKANLLMIVPENFSKNIASLSTAEPSPLDIEFVGNITNINYLISAVLAGDYLNKFILSMTGMPNPVNFKETGIGTSGVRTSFELAVPGLLIFSIIMLMFTASIALVVESEKQTIKRLKLSNVSAFTFLSGISVVQVFVGVVSVLITLLTAIPLGFKIEGSFLLVLLVSALCSISIIAFSLILAAGCKTINHVLVIGNFPLFLFMFFSGSMFPLETKTLFNIGDYNFTMNGILSPSHAVSALNKILIMKEGFSEILPEIGSLTVLSVIYFAIGIFLYHRRHMKIS
ncbi:MAG: ABC transporter permease [Bacteroidetes bacterium]|nr:ABC transporter permease [Bacteroidota bacterium]